MSNDDKTGQVPAAKDGALVPIGKVGGKKGVFLARIRGARAETTAVPVAPRVGSRQALVAAALAPRRRPRLVLAIDATASREHAWSAARQVTDSLFKALPGELDVALAVHGGSDVHTFTDFASDPRQLRDLAAGIRCRAGMTRLLDILDRARQAPDCRVVVYIGDAFEESLDTGLAVCDALRLKGTKLIVLHDRSDTEAGRYADAFLRLAERTGGAVLPFSPDAIQQLRDLLQAVAVLAVGGIKLLEAKCKALPGAQLLLEHLSRNDKAAD